MTHPLDADTRLALRHRAARVPLLLAPDDLLELWNVLAAATGLSRAIGLNDARRVKALARLKEHPDRAYWIQVFRKIGLSPFCRGENDRGWTANIDFILTRSAALRALEGRYDGPVNGKHSDAKDLLQEWLKDE